MASFSLPKGFVYLHDVAPDIIEDIRYATHNNFIGNPIPGYKRGVCIVTRQTAQQLKKRKNTSNPKDIRLKYMIATGHKGLWIIFISGAAMPKIIA